MAGALVLCRRVLFRLCYALAVLFFVIVLSFVLLHLAPGDIADTIAGDMGGISEDNIAEIRAAYGLDKPLLVQLGSYLARVAFFDFGYSYLYNEPVVDLIFERLPATLILVVSAQVLALTIGIGLGVIAALKPNGCLSHFVTFLSLFGYSAPVFWTGIMLLVLFSLTFNIFPVAGMADPALTVGSFDYYLSVVHHMVLPTLSLAIIFVALYSRLCRASMIEVLGADYIRTARAKGLSETQVIGKHALKNALGPVLTLAGLQLSAVVSGAIVVETVFGWPGLGTLALGAILARDIPTILGILFFSALVVVVGNIVTDVILRSIDPRIRSK